MRVYRVGRLFYYAKNQTARKICTRETNKIKNHGGFEYENNHN